MVQYKKKFLQYIQNVSFSTSCVVLNSFSSFISNLHPVLQSNIVKVSLIILAEAKKEITRLISSLQNCFNHNF